jgi:hypothetical protein
MGGDAGNTGGSDAGSGSGKPNDEVQDVDFEEVK